MDLRFTWDAGKGASNQRKHGVEFEEATTVFGDTLSITIADPRHSDREDRSVIIGMSDRRHLLVVVFAEQNSRIRIISARAATARERTSYEEGSWGEAG